MTKILKTSITLTLILIINTLIIGCGGSNENKSGEDNEGSIASILTPKLEVNSSLQVFEEVLSETNQTIGIIAFDEGDGLQKTQFIKNELIISTKSEVALEKFLTKWKGKILDKIELNKFEKTSNNIYVVEVNVSNAPVNSLNENLKKLQEEGNATIMFSSNDGLELFAISLDESVNNDLNISLNIVLQNNADSTVQQILYESKADYFNWDYLKLNGTHQIGVLEAWNLLLATDKLRRSVEIMVFDGGFQYDSLKSMYPVGSRIEGQWNKRNRFKTSQGTEAPWHGTNVVATAMGQLYEYGSNVVGPAAPVAKLVAVDPGSMVNGKLTLRKWFKIIKNTLLAPLKDRPNIINISASGYVPFPLNKLIDPIVNTASYVARRNGILIFASAGNAGKSVDAKKWGIERGTYIPCESKDVICVGGMQKFSTLVHPNSNYGEGRGNSVDIYAPYVVKGYELNNDGSREYALKDIYGTSYSSPFVAGVAALVWAANKNLSANEVEGCLLSSAYDNDDIRPNKRGSQKRINALGAVKCALNKSGITYPIVKILSPSTGSVFNEGGKIKLKVIAINNEGKKVNNISFSSNINGILSSKKNEDTNEFTLLGLTSGTHIITASAIGVSDTVSIITSNDAPHVTIYSPLNHHIYYVDDTIYSLASVYDSGAKLTASQVKWSMANSTIQSDSFSSIVGSSGYHHSFTNIKNSLLFSDEEHKVKVVANDGEFRTEDKVEINFLAIPKGNSRPNLNILLPANSSTIDKGKLIQKTFSTDDIITFKGIAIDAEDGTMDGSKMVWTYTYIDTGVTGTLCRGGDKDCSEFSYEANNFKRGVIDITMEVVDSGGVRVQKHIIMSFQPRID